MTSSKGKINSYARKKKSKKFENCCFKIEKIGILTKIRWEGRCKKGLIFFKGPC